MDCHEQQLQARLQINPKIASFRSAPAVAPGKATAPRRRLRLALMGLGVVASCFGAVPTRAAGPNCFVPGDYSSIQAAVNDANCTTVVLNAPQYTENVSISRTVTIFGLGRGLTSVTSLTLGASVFQVRNSAPGNVSIVTLHGMTITGGHADFGGGINNVAATLLLDDVLVTGNRADSGGGGIYNAGGGKLSLAASTVSGNSAGQAGGGIYNTAAHSTSMFDHVPTQGELTTNFVDFVETFPDLFSAGTTFVQQFQTVPFNLFQTFKTEVQQKVDTTALHDLGSNPASLFVNYAIFTVTFLGNSQVTGNIVDGSLTSLHLGFGAGIMNELGVTVMAANSSVDNNTVTASAIAGGGGILNFGLMGIYNSTITKNAAIPSGQVKGLAFGGGILNMLGRLNIGNFTAPTEVVNITNNALNSTFASFGGGIESVFGSTYIYFAHVDGNTIPPNANGGFVRGAGISNDAVPVPVVDQIVFTPEVHIFDSTVNNNVIGTTLGTPRGGGIQSRTDLDLTRTTVSGNTATSTIGDAEGAGIWSGHGFLTISKSTISGNTATSGLFLPNQNHAQGGGIYSEGTNLSIAQSTVALNSVVSQSAATLVSYARGGGIFYQPANQSAIESGTVQPPFPVLTIDASTIVNNSVSATCTLCGGTNPAVVQDGGIFAVPQTVTFGTPTGPTTVSLTTVNVYGSILTGNTAGSCSVAPNTSLNNLSDDPTCGATAVTDPLLLGLADFGGPTLTYVPLPASPARNAGFPAGDPHCFPDDQRGVPHTGNGPCDVGSVQGPPFLVSALSGQGAATGTIGTGGAITATLSQALDPTTAVAANVIVLSKFQGKLTATVTYDVPSRTLTIQPSAPLIVGDTLSTLLTSGLLTTAGEKLLPFQKQLTVIGAPFCVSNSFQPVTTNLPNVEFGSIEWADYDGDGKLDAVITGVTGVTFDTAFPFGPIYTYVTEVYHNDGNGHFTPINAGITPVGFGDAVWGDYDGDGKPDLLVMGRKQSHYLLPAQDGNPNDSLITTPGTGFAAVYHNNGDGTFTKVQEFFGFENGQAAWVDLNNDGKLDVVLVGVTYGDISLVPPASILPPTSSKIYRNAGGAFVDAGSLPVFNGAALAVADYDSDGRMDLSVGGYAYFPFSFTGISGLFAAPLTNIFHNLSGGISPLFPNTNGPLPELRFGSMDWADVDGDGKPDLLLSGESLPQNGPPVPFTDVFKNNGDGTFTAMNAGLPAVNFSSVRFGDYDNDGHPDILVTGLTPAGFNQGTTTVFHNDGTGTFTQVATLPPGISYSYASWADMNGDGKLEFSVVGSPTTGGGMLTQIFTPAICRGADVSYTTPKNATLAVPAPGLLTNASSQRAVTGVTAATQPVNGTLADFPGDGSFIYTPNAGFFGTDTFTFNIQDSAGASTQAATVTITVLPQAVACWATSDGGTTVLQGINGSVVQQAIDAAAIGATVRIAGMCAGSQSRAGDSQTAYLGKNLTLEGGYSPTNWGVSDPVANPTTLDAAGSGHVVNVGVGVTATIDNLILTGGARQNGGGVLNAGNTTLSNVVVTNNNANNGGGVANSGTLALTGVSISANTAAAGGGLWNSGGGVSTIILNSTLSGNLSHGAGGAIFNAQSASLNVTASTLTGNQSGGNGAALANDTGGTAAILNSTFVGNVANGFGGASSATGGAGTTIRSSTISGNSAARGGGIYVLGGSATFVNTINVKNSNGDCSGPVTSLGHNVDTDTTCNFHAAGDLAVDPQLLPLASNGGPTQTELLSFKSPAIDKGDNTQCPPTDQRGFARPAGAACDIGALEQSVPGVAAANDAYAAAAGAPLNVSAASGVLTNDFSKDNSTLTAQLSTTTSNGTLALVSDGSFTYTANPNFTGNDSFTYTATNALGTSTPATVSISVTAVQSCSATVDGVTIFTSTDFGAVQSAINSALAGSTVKVAGTCAGVFGVDVLQDFSAEGTTVYINRSLTLQGGYVAGQWTAAPDPIAHPTILDAQGHGRVVTIESRYTQPTTVQPFSAPIATNVTLNGLTLQNGFADTGQAAFSHGGAIAVLGANVTIQNCIVQNSKTDGNGGGLYFATTVDDRNMLIPPNTAQSAFNFRVYDVNNYNATKSGLLDGDFTKLESIDGGPFVQLSGSISEPFLPANPGDYQIALTAAELNGNVITLRFSAPGAMPMDIILRTSATLAVGNPYTLNVSSSSFTNNTANGIDAVQGNGGGGIYLASTQLGVTAPATVSITNTSVAGNQTPVSGGGLFNDGATATFTQGTISGNTALDGGGFAGAGTLTMQNTTVSGNHATQNGGAANYSGTAQIANSTVASNSALNLAGGLIGGGIQITNSIVALNNIGDCNGVASAGGNVDSDGSCKSQSSDKTLLDPGLLPLSNNGGTTETQALSSVSGAINAGVNCLLTDQRGQPRLGASAVCDSGAFELGPSVGAQNDTYRAQKNIPLVVNAANGVLANDLSTSGGAITASKLTNPAHGSVTLNSDGSFTYTPTAGFTGPDSFTYAALQGALSSSAATVNIRVVPLLTCAATPDNGTTVFPTVQQAIDAASSGGTVKVAGICTGTTTKPPIGFTTYTQTAFINKPLSLIGGFDGTNWNATPDPVANQTILDANHTGGVVDVIGTSVGMQVTLQNLMMINSTSVSTSFGLGSVDLSGANVTISNFEISGGQAINGDGGGVHAGPSTMSNGAGGFTPLPMTLTLSNGAIVNNQAILTGNFTGGVFGGGLALGRTTATITNVTISGNSATTGGGGMYVTSSGVNLNNSTLTGNSVTSLAGTGGAINGGVTGSNTILSGNTSASGNCTVALNSLGYNLDSDGSCHLGATADISLVDASLAPVANNGGSTSTAALLPGSRAINAGDCTAGTVTTDQRGVARPQGAACDIGAYELAAGGSSVNATVPAGGSATTDPVGTGANPTNPLQVTVTTPNAGTITIQVNTNNTAPAGFTTVGWQAAITAPAASAAIPLRIAFTLDASIVPAGQNEKTIQIFRNATLLPNCSSSNGTANPDPCVATRVVFSNGDVELDVFSSAATNSTWTFNVPISGPAILLPPTASAFEGAAFVQSGSFTDSASTSWTATVDYGDGLGVLPLSLIGKTFSLSHIYPGVGAFIAKVSVTGLGGTSTANLNVLVNNVAPVVSAGADTILSAGTLFSRTGNFADAGAETWSASVSYGDGASFALPLNPDKSFGLSHSYGKPGVYVVGVVVTDSLGASGTASFKVTIANAAPVVTALPPQTVPQGSSAVLQLATFTDGGALERHTATIDWGDTAVTPAIVIDNGNSGVVSGLHAYSTTGSYTAAITVTDDSGASGTATIAVTVTNSAPSVLVPARLTVDEASQLISSGSFVDVGANKTWTATVDYGDGTGSAPLTLNADKSFALAHVYPQSGTFTATVTVKDSNAGQNTATTLVVVNDVPPAVSLGAGGTIQLGAIFSASGSFSDPGAQTWTATVDYGDGTGVQALALNLAKTFALSHTYATPGSFTVTVVVTDSGGASGSKTLVETVTGVAPTIAITNPANSATISGLLSVVATVTGNATVTGVTFAVDGAQIGATLTTAPFVTLLDARTLAAGTHTITATVNSSAGTSMASISVTVNNSAAPGDAVVDSSTVFSVQVADNNIATTCLQCSFASLADMIPGQTIEVRRRPNSNPPAAAQIVLKQGSISGTITSAGATSFTLQASDTLLQNVTIQVLTDSSTVLEGFSGAAFAAQQKVVVRGFLYKGSSPGTAILVARQVELVQ